MATVWPDTSRSVEALNTNDVEAAKRGDRRAYARLVKLHQRVVTSITLAITTDVDASEDAAQEAFLAGWRDLRTLDDPGRFGPWICQIARHRAYDIVRKRGRTSEQSDDEAVESAPDPGPGALEALLEGEQLTLIHGALEALPEDSREAMILFYREGQSIAEVARVLDVSEDVVKKRLSRARERMRQSVEAALGAALLATVPPPDFALQLFGGIRNLRVLARLRAWGKLRAVITPFRVIGLAAATVAIVSTPQFKTWRSSMRLYVPAEWTRESRPSPLSTSAPRHLAAPPFAPEIRGRVEGPGRENATGTATLACKGVRRVETIEHGGFDAKNLPTGPCRITVSMDGAVQKTTDTVLGTNEVFNLAIRLVDPPLDAIPGHPHHP